MDIAFLLRHCVLRARAFRLFSPQAEWRSSRRRRPNGRACMQRHTANLRLRGSAAALRTYCSSSCERQRLLLRPAVLAACWSVFARGRARSPSQKREIRKRSRQQREKQQKSDHTLLGGIKAGGGETNLFNGTQTPTKHVFVELLTPRATTDVYTAGVAISVLKLLGFNAFVSAAISSFSANEYERNR